MKSPRMKWVALAVALGIGPVSLSACNGGAASTPTQSSVQAQQLTTTLTGVVALRGAQIEAWWGMRAQDGKLWRLAPATAQIKDALVRLNNQSVQVEGTPLESAAQGDFPVLQVTKIF